MNALTIREATPGDLESLTAIYNHYVVHTHITFDLQPVTIENRRVWLTHYNQDARYRLFAGVKDDQVIGYASSSQFRTKPAYDQSVETTIYLSPDATGHGFGHRLYEHLLQSLDPADVHRCYGVIALPNDASVSLHKRLGFSEAGKLTEVGFKFDQYWDTLWMERSLG